MCLPRIEAFQSGGTSGARSCPEKGVHMSAKSSTLGLRRFIFQRPHQNSLFIPQIEGDNLLLLVPNTKDSDSSLPFCRFLCHMWAIFHEVNNFLVTNNLVVGIEDQPLNNPLQQSRNAAVGILNILLFTRRF